MPTTTETACAGTSQYGGLCQDDLPAEFVGFVVGEVRAAHRGLRREKAPAEEFAPSDLPGWDVADQVANRAFGDAWPARPSCACPLWPCCRSATPCSTRATGTSRVSGRCLQRSPGAGTCSRAATHERRRGNDSSAGRAGASPAASARRSCQGPAPRRRRAAVSAGEGGRVRDDARLAAVTSGRANAA